MNFFDLLAEDNDLVIIRKSILKICDFSFTATLILSKALFYAQNSKADDKSFYKFKEPCSSNYYKKGDSWCEVLGISKFKFDKGLQVLKDKGFIETKKDINRRTFYLLKFKAIETAINEQKQGLNQQSEVNQYQDIPQQTKTLKTQKNQPKKPKQIIQTQELNTIDDDEPNLPFFIDIEVWHKYLRYKSERREIIGAMQKEQLFQTLTKMHEQGIDVNQAILNSIANGYKGIFGEKQKVDINSQDYAMQKTREACERLAKIYEAKEKAEREANVSRETNKGATNGF